MIDALVNFLTIFLGVLAALEVHTYATSGSRENTLINKITILYYKVTWKIASTRFTKVNVKDQWYGNSKYKHWHPTIKWKNNNVPGMLKPEINDWIKDNCKGTVYLGPYRPHDLCFTNADDAMHFRMRW